MKVAEKWKSDDRGDHVVFFPPNAPVGMDVYMMGHYTPGKEADAKTVFDTARSHVAEMFAKNFDASASAKTMKPMKVADVDALFFTAPAPAKADMTWRQWVFVKDGWCFAIVSVISDENEAVNLPAVVKMVKSFQMAKAKKPESSAE